MGNEQASTPRFEYQGGEIRLDNEGRWFHEGVEITHKLTAELFSQSVKKHPDGGYCLEVGVERARIVVDDTPYMVGRVTVEGGVATARLNDKSEEDLDLASLRVGEDNVLYCRVKNGEFPARLLRPAYYQLMKYLEETDDGYAVRIGEKLWPIKIEGEIKPG